MPFLGVGTSDPIQSFEWANVWAPVCFCFFFKIKNNNNLGPILGCMESLGDQPEEDLARFGYK
jgi:hypothetical protein